MLKKHMAACLVASAFMTMPVLAQTSTTPGATSPTPPATSAPPAGMGAASGAAAGGKFITEQQGAQWRASRLIGLDVYGADNQKIGDVNEVLVDRQGNADAVVVGVGGFLGIGEKNVALPFSAFEWQMEDTRRTASTAGSGAAGSGTAGSTAATGTTATTGTSAPAATASTSPAGSSATGASAQRGYPDHAILRMTKADLEGAPTFRYVGESRSDSGAARSTSPATGTGTSSPATAPKQ